MIEDSLVMEEGILVKFPLFSTSPCGARTTIEEKRKRTVLASSRKRVDILYHLKWKYIVLVFHKFVCVMSIFLYLFF